MLNIQRDLMEVLKLPCTDPTFVKDWCMKFQMCYATSRCEAYLILNLSCYLSVEVIHSVHIVFSQVPIGADSFAKVLGSHGKERQNAF